MHTCIHVSYTYVAADCIQVHTYAPSSRLVTHGGRALHYRAPLFPDITQTSSVPRTSAFTHARDPLLAVYTFMLFMQ